jgi:hypothetical protein
MNADRIPAPLENGTLRSSGLTLVELAFATSLVFVVFGGIAVAITALTGVSVEAQQSLIANSQVDRARLRLLDDLQTTDTLGTDSSAARLVQVRDHGGGAANLLAFRRVEGYTVDVESNVVTSRYGPEVRYYVSGEGHLVRDAEGAVEVVALNITSVRFSISSMGCLTADLAAFSGTGTSRMESTQRLQLTPRNVNRSLMSPVTTSSAVPDLVELAVTGEGEPFLSGGSIAK